MGIFQHFPYTNFHEMNLDWFLKEWKKFSDNFDVWKHEVDETLAEFKNYIDNVPFDEYTEKVLQKWLDDGTLADLISALVIPQRDIIMARELRYLSTPTNPLGGQGCYFDGNYMYICGTTDTGQIINKCDLNGNVIDSHSFNDLGHANSIAVYDTKAYVADGNAPQVTVLNTITWATENVLTPAEFDNIWSVSVDNGKVYVLGSDVNAPTSVMLFGEIIDNAVVVKHSISNPENSVRQNMCVKGKSIYALFNMANMIYEYNIDTAALISALYIPAGDGYYPVGEPEDIFVMNDDVYLLGDSYYRYDYTYPSNYVAQIFKTNVIAATNVQSKNEYSYMPAEARLILKVDDTANVGKNPYDTFTTLEEACLIANYHKTGDIEALNIDEGVVHLINGDYKITMAAGARKITRLWCENSNLYLFTASEIHDIAISRVNLYLHNISLYGSFNATFSRITLVNVDMANLESISGVASDYKFNKVASVNPALAITANNRSTVEILSAAVNNILLLLKISGAGATFTAFNTGGIIFLVTQTMVSNQAISITVDGSTVTYADGAFSGDVTDANIIQLKQVAIQ